MPYLLTCSRVNLSCVLTYSRANMSCSHTNVCCVLTCSCTNVSCVLTSSCGNMPFVLTHLCDNALCVLYMLPHYMCCVLTCSRVNVPCVLTCSRTITWNNKKCFQWHVLLRSFYTFSLSFSCKMRLYVKSASQAGMSLEIFIWEFSSTFLHFSYQAEALNGNCDKLCTIKWS